MSCLVRGSKVGLWRSIAECGWRGKMQAGLSHPLVALSSGMCGVRTL